MKRVLTSLVLIPFALYSVFFAPDPVFIGIAVAMALLCYHEYSDILAAQGLVNRPWAGYAGGLLAMWRPDLLPVIAVGFLLVLLTGVDLRVYLISAAALLLGTVYVFGAWRACIELRAISPVWLLYALAINWVGDVAAFYVGRRFGKHKLAPAISPGKSWEGAIASVVTALGFGSLYHWQFQTGVSLPFLLALSGVANVAGQAGDLAESAMKRAAGLKDSGRLLPGHGGFLDRLDSSLFTMPVVLCALRLAGLRP